jgi:pimeloyl-ACP methyl ester carboxylesterase
MKAPGIGKWRTDEAHRRFVEMEDELWREHWPRPPDALDLETSAGMTRVYRWPGEGEVVVFLHGMGATGLSWSPYVERLAGFDVYAVDTIGDVGRSEHRAVIEDAAGLALWLDETLAAASLDRAHLAGTSYGGFLALNLAARIPQRVASLTVIDGGGLAPFRLARFMLWGMPMLLGSLAPRRLRERLARSRPTLEDPRVMRMALHAQRNHAFRLPAAEPLTDDELRSISAPTAVLVAEKSAPFASNVQAARARLIPHAEVVVIEGARHELSWTHVEECVELLKAQTRAAARDATDSHASSSAGTNRSAANTAAS